MGNHGTAKAEPAATILVVDDEPQNVSLMVEVLEYAGYATLAAASGQEALDALAKQRPDAVLLDLLMPGMDGFEVIRRMRADAASARIPIMVVTASHLDERAREFLSQNTQSLFQKGSFWVEELLREVERVLKGRAGQ